MSGNRQIGFKWLSNAVMLLAGTFLYAVLAW